MSDEPTSLHEAHEQAEQAHTHQKPDNYTLRMVCVIAVLSGIFAMVDEQKEKATTAFLSSQIDTSDWWAQYQAKSNRIETNQIQLSLLGVLSQVYTDPKISSTIDKEISSIKNRIEHLSSEDGGRANLAEKAKEENHHKEHELHRMHSYALSTKGLHIAIILASLGLVIRHRWIGLLSIGIGGCATIGAILIAFGLI